MFFQVLKKKMEGKEPILLDLGKVKLNNEFNSNLS